MQQALDGEKAYGQVGFTYSEEKKEEGEGNETKKEEEEDEEDAPFIVPHELDIPVGMVVVSEPILINTPKRFMNILEQVCCRQEI